MGKVNRKGLDMEIARVYARLAAGMMTIDVMKIGALYRDVRTAVAAGAPVEDAVRAAIGSHCQAVSHG